MKLTINGQEREFNAATMSVAEAVAACEFPTKGVAVAINNVVVRRATWDETRLQGGESLTVIRAVCGG